MNRQEHVTPLAIEFITKRLNNRNMNHLIYPCLWFDGNAKAAATFYCTVFPNSKIVSDNGLVVIFELNGQKFMGLNGGPQFRMNEAVSFVITCDTQGEIDHYWKRLSEGGREDRCGWVKDQFGLSWQVVPSILGELMSDPARAARVVNAYMPMKKLIIEDLVNA